MPKVSAVRRYVTLAVLGALFALPLIATAHQARSGPTLHEERVGIAAPAIVVQALAESARTIEGTPFEVVPLTEPGGAAATASAARQEVAEGRLDAALVLDLRVTRDVLLVSTARTEQYADALDERVSVISEGYGRTLALQRVTPDDATGSARIPGLLVAAWCAVAVLVVAAMSAERGPVAPDLPRGIARLLLVAASGVATGVVSAAVVDADGPVRAGIVAVATAVVTLTGALILAVESLLGLGGLGVAVALMVGPTLPLLTGVTPDLLAEPWHTLDQVSPPTAAWRVTRTTLGHTDGAAGSWALLAAWGAIALLTLLTARAFRPSTAAATDTAPLASA